MISELLRLPCLEQVNTLIPATRYNRVRLGLRRLENRLWLTLNDFTRHEICLRPDVWIVTDPERDYLPIFAITDFARQRDLHSFVPAHLYLYQSHAQRLVPHLLMLMDDILQKRLDRLLPPGPATLVEIPKRR